MRTTRSWHAQAGWLARLARGLDDEAVKPRLLPKSVGCSKTFRGRSALTSLKLVHDWLLSIGAPFLRRDSVSHEASSVIMRATHQGEQTSLLPLTCMQKVAAASGLLHEGGAVGLPTPCRAPMQPGRWRSGWRRTGRPMTGCRRPSRSASPRRVCCLVGAGADTSCTEDVVKHVRTASMRVRIANISHVCAADWQGRENTDCYTRSCPLRKPRAEAIAEDALGLVRRWAGEQQRGWGIYSLGLSTSNFVAAPTGSSTLHRRGLRCRQPVAFMTPPMCRPDTHVVGNGTVEQQ